MHKTDDQSAACKCEDAGIVHELQTDLANASIASRPNNSMNHKMVTSLLSQNKRPISLCGPHTQHTHAPVLYIQNDAQVTHTENHTQVTHI